MKYTPFISKGLSGQINPSGAALPKYALVEIEMTASRG
jgi:hypothetical protein